MVTIKYVHDSYDTQFLEVPEARTSPTKEAINVAEFLNDLILRHGCPDVAISDQGTEFCNQVCPHAHYQTNVTLQTNVTRCHHASLHGERGGGEGIVWSQRHYLR